jgi:hypothetical protein
MRRTGLGLAVGLAAVAVTVAASAAAPAPRLSGRFPTLMRVTSLSHILDLHVGEQALKTWTFTPRCASGGCTTTLVRPSITPGSTTTFRYTLHATSRRRYTGSIEPLLVLCRLANGQEVQGAFTQTQTLVLDVTKVAAGKVVAFKGTERSVNTPTATGRANNCSAGVQVAAFHSTG